MTGAVAWAYTDLAIAVPALGRAHLIEPVYRSAQAATPGARIVFGVTDTDTDVLAEVDRLAADRLLSPPRAVGDYARKVNAIFRATPECGLLFTAATDLLFHPGWFERAVARLQPGIGVVGTNDLGSPRVTAGLHSTHSLVTRAYVVQHGGTFDGGPGTVLHEGYVHEFVDDELVGTARKRRAYAHAADAYVEHRHPDWCPDVPRDPLHYDQGRRMRASLHEYRMRRRRWT